MKQTQAKKIKILIEKELKNFCDKIDLEDLNLSQEMNINPTPIERAYVIEVIQSENDKNYYGVELRTDGEIYELFYEIDSNQKKLMDTIDTNISLKFKEECHYFEKYGGGILHLF